MPHGGHLALAVIASLLLVFGTALAELSKNVSTLVQVDGGKVRGTFANGVIAFKGIPFAQPPVGNYRWRPPQPVKPWEGVREATAFGPNPAQPAAQAPPGADISEGCRVRPVRPAGAASPPALRPTG